MFEIEIYNRLNEAFSGSDINIYMDRPETVPDSYVLMEKTGGTMVGHIPTVTIAFQSNARTLYEAIVLNENVKNAVYGLLNDYNDITRIELNSDYNFTDTTTKTHRYQAVFVFYYYN